MPNTPSRLESTYDQVSNDNELDTRDEAIWIVLIDTIRDYAGAANYTSWNELSASISESFSDDLITTD